MSEISVKRVDRAQGYFIDDCVTGEEGWSIEIAGRESNGEKEVTLYLSREEKGEDAEVVFLNATLGEKGVAQLIRELQDVIGSLKEEQ